MFKLIFLALVLIFKISYLNCQVDFEYHNYDRLTSTLKSLAYNFPSKTYLYSIGKSVQGRDLWVLAIADSNPQVHIPLRPEAKYIGNIHGNEVPSKEVLLHLIDYLLNNQKTDPSVDFLLKNTRIHILPSLNPDGFEMSHLGDCSSTQGRANANGYDLNRDFPDIFNCNSNPVQPETQAVINWLKNNTFVLSANFHEGSMVVNYPFDDYTGSGMFSFAKYSKSSDDDVFKNVALVYSYNHPTMKNTVCGGDHFSNGITNGANWYPINGGMQDYNYWSAGCFEVTIEIGCCKYPPASELQNIWLQNQKSLIEYLKMANTGLRGIITYANGQPAVNIGIKIDSREPIFKTNQNGEYYRLLMPGTYTLTLMLNCNQIYQTSITIYANPGSLVYNITLPDSINQMAKSYVLSKYPLFCTTKVLDCANNNKNIYSP